MANRFTPFIIKGAEFAVVKRHRELLLLPFGGSNRSPGSGAGRGGFPGQHWTPRKLSSSDRFGKSMNLSISQIILRKSSEMILSLN